MKDKKRVLTIVVSVIIAIVVITGIVLAISIASEQKLKNFYKTLEDSACKYAKKENYTKTICDNYENLCKIKYSTLINNADLDGNLTNPETKENIKDNTRNFIEVTWQDGQMVCTHKEG